MKLDKWISSSEILAASSKRQQRGAVLMVGVDEGGICAVETNDLFLPKRQDSDKLSSLFTSLSLSLCYTVTETQASWERITHTMLEQQFLCKYIVRCCIIYYSYRLHGFYVTTAHTIIRVFQIRL